MEQRRYSGELRTDFFSVKIMEKEIFLVEKDLCGLILGVELLYFKA